MKESRLQPSRAIASPITFSELTDPLQYLPHCVLASIVFAIAVGMVDIEGFRGILQESRGEFMLATATAAAVLAVGVEQGILCNRLLARAARSPQL